MGPTEIVGQWTDYLNTCVLSGLGAHLTRALGLFSLGVGHAGACRSGRVARATPSPAMPASRRRRWERWLANPRFDPDRAQRRIARAVWESWHGTRAHLLIDETARGDRVKCLTARLAYRKRALPLAWACYRPDRPPGGMVRLVNRLLARALEHAPPGVRVVVTADRGLSWPSLVDACAAGGHHYLLRVQGQTRVRLPDGRRVAARDLAPRPGGRPWLGRADVFQQAGWRAVSLVAIWARGCREPWLLITDQAACAGRWREYARRMWIEEAIRDDKSQGLEWDRSRVGDPRRVARLHVILALAALLAVSLGTWLIKRGLRHELDPRRRRRLSVLPHGLQALASMLAGLRPNWPLQMTFHPT